VPSLRSSREAVCFGNRACIGRPQCGRASGLALLVLRHGVKVGRADCRAIPTGKADRVTLRTIHRGNEFNLRPIHGGRCFSTNLGEGKKCRRSWEVPPSASCRGTLMLSVGNAMHESFKWSASRFRSWPHFDSRSRRGPAWRDIGANHTPSTPSG